MLIYHAHVFLLWGALLEGILPERSHTILALDLVVYSMPYFLGSCLVKFGPEFCNSLFTVQEL
jgi:hypothetical protein